MYTLTIRSIPFQTNPQVFKDDQSDVVSGVRQDGLDSAVSLTLMVLKRETTLIQKTICKIVLA